MTRRWARLTCPALAVRHASPWRRKMSATSSLGRGGSRGLAKNDIRALAPARAPAARPQIEPPGSEPPTSAAAPRYGVAAAVGGSLKMTLGPWLLLARRPPGRRSSPETSHNRDHGRRGNRGASG